MYHGTVTPSKSISFRNALRAVPPSQAVSRGVRPIALPSPLNSPQTAGIVCAHSSASVSTKRFAATHCQEISQGSPRIIADCQKNLVRRSRNKLSYQVAQHVEGHSRWSLGMMVPDSHPVEPSSPPSFKQLPRCKLGAPANDGTCPSSGRQRGKCKR